MELSHNMDSIMFFLECGISICESFIEKGDSEIREDKIED